MRFLTPQQGAPGGVEIGDAPCNIHMRYKKRNPVQNMPEQSGRHVVGQSARIRARRFLRFPIRLSRGYGTRFRWGFGVFGHPLSSFHARAAGRS
ncbi:hypothetical protein AA21291_1733 [Swaminathania salitolerans LMG 21291]|uniref:Uncharacterized protein n=1 Tax=Swaminathania salitolerans TaxID=182838 RepID=A0A511BRN3_9PROT|nr:hypothetical protein AA21291_1733 [Swaminathania salitolerans LMG 21291]GEL02925.1 hypothetical protein SSA02_20880 [Swaminathania salitolerans]